jgi:hypothetical protein
MVKQFITRLDPIVPKPAFFPKFEAAVTAVMEGQPTHQKSRVDAFCQVLNVAKAVPEVATVLGLEGYF